jgi:RNA recognition motif-containing protein
MSDAPAALGSENGVLPVAQENLVQETPGFKVFAGNLAYSTTDEGLKAFFEPVESDILSAQVIQRRTRGGTRSAGYGFVALATVEAAQKAVDLLNKKELDSREVIIEIAKPAEEKDKEERPRKAKSRSGRRGQKSVPGEVTDAEASGETDKAVDTPADGEEKPRKKKKKNNNRRKHRPAAAEAEEAAPAPAEGTEAAKKPKRKARAPRPHRPAGEDPVGEPSKTVLFVANLGFNIEDDGLAALFTDAGINVNSARIVRRRWGKPRKSKGYGFVDVGDEAEQQKAIAALEGKEIGGRTIAVKVAVNTTPQPSEDPEANREPTPDATILAS